MRQKSEWKCGHKIVITLFLRIWRNVSPKKGINFLEIYIYIYIYTHIFVWNFAQKNTLAYFSQSNQKNSKNKKGWQKGESLAGGNTKKVACERVGLTQPFWKREYTQSIFWLNVPNWLKLISIWLNNSMCFFFGFLVTKFSIF
jgi:hypothetical protein